MHHPVRGITAVVLASAALAAQAQTCDAPLALPTTPLEADTCDASDSLPEIPGHASPQPDYVTTFQGSPALSGRIAAKVDFDAVVLLKRAPCPDSTPPVFYQAAFAGETLDIPIGGLAETRYLLIVTGDPAGPADGCGTFHLVPFVDYDGDCIFANGFEP